MTDAPLVSVITIFYNAAKFFDEAIRSVLAQSYSDWELLLVDDGSTDQSTELAKRYAGEHPEKIRYLEHEGHVNRGMSATRNLGIRHARGKYVAFLDADDVWLPEKLERQVPILESQPDVGMLYGPTLYWRSWTGLDQDRESDSVPDLGVPLDTRFTPPTLLTILYPLGQASAPCLCSLLVRRDVLARIKSFQEEFLGYYEDQAFLTKVYLNESVYVSSGCWDKYRIHPDSCCAEVERSGDYDSYRWRFLQWFKAYLQSRDVSDPVVWNALNSALQPPGHSRERSRQKWYLRVAEGNQAQLVSALDQSDMVRVEVTRNVSGQAYDTQLNLPDLEVRAGEQCLLSFECRADVPRTISFGFAMGRSPWSNLGLHDQIDVATSWRRYEREFTVDTDEHDARIHFDLGGSNISVELSSVTLLNTAEGRVIEQNRPPAPAGRRGVADTPDEPWIPVHEVQFGSLRRLTPISRDFGCDRGQPIDRYYIENFLEKHSADVRGRVLEIGENTYTRRFGGERVTRSDILHVTEGEPQATIIADLASADHIPSNAFDCIILTQTLQLIYDVPAALRQIRRILKPSGVLLATFPGITQSYDHEWASTWYWNFTAISARRLFAEAFGAENVAVETFGNVLAAMSFLQGLAVEELTTAELDYREPGYDLTITVRAVKRGEPPVAGQALEAGQPVQIAAAKPAVGHQAMVLMYHRIADSSSDPFSLAVSPQHFAEQLANLRYTCDVVSLHELVEKLDEGRLERPTAAITFDDGYVDNLLAAKPVLERFELPATVFLTTGYVGGQREFWWDELDRLLLQPGVLPRQLELNLGGKIHRWDLGDSSEYSLEEWHGDRGWVVSQLPRMERHAAFFDIWRLIQFLSDAERRLALDELWAWAGTSMPVRPTHRPMTPEEIVKLVEGGLVQVGAHTVTHPVLSRLTVDEQRTEIQRSVAHVQEIVAPSEISFAYPFGSPADFTDETMELVREAGCRCACSTVPRLVKGAGNRFQLPRFQIDNWNGDEFGKQLRQFLN